MIYAFPRALHELKDSSSMRYRDGISMPHLSLAHTVRLPMLVHFGVLPIFVSPGFVEFSPALDTIYSIPPYDIQHTN